MQVILNIDSSNIGTTVEEVFKSLSEEEKKDIAKQMMMDVLSTPNGTERAVYEEKVISQIMEAKSKDVYDRRDFDTPEKTRNSYQFRDTMKSYVSSRERLIQEITQQAILQYQASVIEMVANDSNLKAVYEEVKQAIVDSYPQMVQAALVSYLASQMGQIGLAVQNSQNLGAQTGMLFQQLTAKLQTHGINLNVSP